MPSATALFISRDGNFLLFSCLIKLFALSFCGCIFKNQIHGYRPSPVWRRKQPAAAWWRRKHLKQPCVYILASKPFGTLYTGVTSDISQRIQQHKEADAGGFVKKYNVKTLVWYELHPTMESAITREKAIKEWKRAWKINLINKDNPHWLDLSMCL